MDTAVELWALDEKRHVLYTFAMLFLLLVIHSLAADISRPQMQHLIDNFQEAATPLIERALPGNSHFSVALLWDEQSQTLGGAYTRAWRENNQVRRQIVIEGPLVKHPAITVQGLPIVLCHELGHYLVGVNAFYKPNWGKYNLEMLIDHYATAVCLPQLLQHPYFAQLYNSPSTQEAILNGVLGVANYLYDFYATHQMHERNSGGVPALSRQSLDDHERDFSQCTLESYRRGLFHQDLPQCALIRRKRAN